MNTKILMLLSVVFLGLIGILLSFFTKEVDTFFNSDSNNVSVLFLQLTSALYLGFALMNWMAKDSRIGGIYNRPIVIGNLMNFGVGTIALMKIVPKIELHKEFIIGLAIFYAIFTICFAIVFKTNPKN